jgi:hypothetical protein
MRRLQFSLKTMLVAMVFFALGMAVQKWYDRQRIEAVETHEQFVRNYEATLSEHADRDVAAVRRVFDAEMARMSEMLEDAYEGERRARQELVQSRQGR